RDGTLMVSDWADGQRPKRGRGRIYHIAHAGGPARISRRPEPGAGGGPGRWLAQLDSESYSERCDAQAALERSGGREAVTEALVNPRLGARGRLHAVWALAHVGGAAAIDDLLRTA